MLLLELDTDEKLYEEDDNLYATEELLDFDGDLEYPYDVGEDEE